MSSQAMQKICPKCAKKSVGTKDIEEFFGFRKMRGFDYPQSNCRLCRRKSDKKHYTAKVKNPNLKGIDLRTVDISKSNSSEIEKIATSISKISKLSLWKSLTIKQRVAYLKGEKEYLALMQKAKESQNPIVKKKYLRKAKALSNFRKDLLVFQKATMNRPKKVIKR